MDTNLERVIKTAVELGAAQTMVALGVSSGEISTRRAKEVYGKWFNDAQVAGRIAPSRCDSKTHYYSVIEILRLKEIDAVKATLIQ